MNYYQYCQSFPPILCRLLAQNGGKVMTDQQISDAINPKQPRLGWVGMMSDELTWDWLRLRDIQDFTRACGIDFCNPKQMRTKLDYLRRKPTLDYLRKSPEWKAYYLPLLVRWRASVKLGELHPYVKALAVRLTPILP